LYAVCNTLSQYTYIDKTSGEIVLKKELANDLIYHLLINANLTVTDVKRICKEHNTEIIIKKDANENSLGKSIKYLKSIKKLIDSQNMDWRELIEEEQLAIDTPSKLHVLGEILSKYQTPKRKRKELSKLSWVDDKFISAAMGYKFSGTANVGYRYMIDSINAFLNGESYGVFQARFIKEYKTQQSNTLLEKLPRLEDEYITKNPVVFRAINEARKIINAIIEKYGPISTINIEVASDVNRSYQERQKILKSQKENEKTNDRIKQKIIELYNVENVTSIMIDRYKLYQQQEGKCLYSGKPIDETRLFDRCYEVDHIVPYSLVLDNSLHNKALVLSTENQYKSQRTPLEYMGKEKADMFVARVNEMYRAKKISDKKYQYLMLPNIYAPECLDRINDWKSRNINDTRYITKYIIGYICDNLKFANGTKVHGVKGSNTARFRRLWLNENTWGSKDRDNSNLHHAVDALIVANLTPAYVEIASDNRKLYQIYKSAGKVKTEEYKEYLKKCISKMKTIYGFDEEYSTSLLTKIGRVPSRIPNLRDEIDIRFNNTDEELFIAQIHAFYQDEEFEKTLHMPLVSYKQHKKLQGEMTSGNPLRIREINGELYKLNRKTIADISKKHLEKIYSDDKDLIDTLSTILADKSDKYTVGDYLKENNLQYFTTEKGTVIHKVTTIDKAYNNPYYKIISEKNKTALDANKYYCIEIYEDNKGKTQTRGIRRVDIIKKDKKMWLTCDYPDNYKNHIMYLHPCDYVVVKNKAGKVKLKGFYKSVKSINRGSFYFAFDNKPFDSKTDIASIGLTDTVEKYHIDMLGYLGGKIKCGAPLSLLKEKK
ncbi:MAG: type II CRISPR RNA-guided endonuclease Cas9, partial [Eubacteriales bacterium]|nr:type II CRISPR RNA-guided endonuclease Cas9 [Eubacteriales bacterium]